MAKWCTLFGSTGNDHAHTLRVLPTYDLTFVADVDGQYISDGPGNLPVGTPMGGEDVAVQYYWEYGGFISRFWLGSRMLISFDADPPTAYWPNPPVQSSPATLAAVTCPLKKKTTTVKRR